MIVTGSSLVAASIAVIRGDGWATGTALGIGATAAGYATSGEADT
jgi:hypothetical protein